jgi:hypothetical protein
VLISSNADPQCAPTPTLRLPAKHQPASLIFTGRLPAGRHSTARPVGAAFVGCSRRFSSSSAAWRPARLRRWPRPRTRVWWASSRPPKRRPSRARRRPSSGDASSHFAAGFTSGRVGYSTPVPLVASARRYCRRRCRCSTVSGRPLCAVRPSCDCRSQNRGADAAEFAPADTRIAAAQHAASLVRSRSTVLDVPLLAPTESHSVIRKPRTTHPPAKAEPNHV